MKILIALALMAVAVAGCANGGGKQVIKGAARGAGHGVVEDVGKSNTGKGAAHGALNATHQIRDQNRATVK